MGKFIHITTPAIGTTRDEIGLFHYEEAVLATHVIGGFWIGIVETIAQSEEHLVSDVPAGGSPAKDLFSSQQQ